jgi:hypothetical protein
MQRRRRAVIAICVCAVLAVLVLTLPTVFGSSYQFLQHRECRTQAVLEKSLFWTPLYILDSPPNGTANATAYAPREPILWSNATNGEAIGMFTLDLWEVYSQKLVWVSGAGQSQACPALRAVDLSRTGGAAPNFGINESVLLPVGSTSDVGVPNSVNLTNGSDVVYPSVLFYAAYPPNQTFLNIICGYGGYETLTITQSFVGVVLVPYRQADGMNSAVPVFLVGEGSFYYKLPGSGAWDIGWYTVPNPFGTGFAFKWEGTSQC